MKRTVAQALRGGAITVLLVPLALLCWCADSASAAAPAAAWELEAVAQPTSFSPADNSSAPSQKDNFFIEATNIGAGTASGPITVVDDVPAGLTIVASAVHAEAQEAATLFPCGVSGQRVECVYSGSLGPGDAVQVTVPVEVDAGVTSGPLEADLAAVEGGGVPTAGTEAPASVEVARPFGVTSFTMLARGADGSLDTQAGDHPYALRTQLELASRHNSIPNGGSSYPVEEAKDVLVALPLGLVGNPTSLPHCAAAALEVSSASCPAASRVGTIVLNLEGIHQNGLNRTQYEAGPIYNLEPQPGYPAEFGFRFAGKMLTIYASVIRLPGGVYGLRVAAPGIPVLPGTGTLVGASLNFFGNPAERNGGQTASQAFFTDPTQCTSLPLTTAVEADSWEHPGLWVGRRAVAFPGMTGCDRLRFEPTFSLQPEVATAETPSGLTVTLKVPQGVARSPILATPDLKDARVTLPSGLALSPSAANGLTGCAAEGPAGINIGSADIGHAGQDLGDPEATELGAGHPGGNSSPYDDGIWHLAPGHCPASSQIGDVEVKTPLLEQPLTGHVYVAEPECGGTAAPCTEGDAAGGRLYGIYLEASGSGVIVKLHGRVFANPATGQLTASFTENPQLPFEEFVLRLYGGPTAALATPQTCGSYQTSSNLTPWSAPQTPDAHPSSTFGISSGANGSACAFSEAQMPDSPSFEAGTTSPLAAQYSSFVLKVAREDGSQQLRSLDVTLPEGLLARLAGTPYCPDPAIAAASGRSGTAEKESPSCPPASEVGTVTVGAGPGQTPYYVQGHAYLAGPYKGSPLSLAIVTPAVAGPFDLGTVVVRTALYVNQETAQVSARSDDFPTILDGTPLDVRSVALKLDKSHFTLNPTNCEAMSVSAEAVSPTGSVAPLRNLFQVGGCKGLGFAPKLALRVFGKANRNAKPRLRAVLRMKEGEANIRRAQVNLPHSLFLEQNHIKTVCTRVQWAQGDGNGSACPTGSVYGYARAWSPLLAEPIQGPVYLRSNGGERKLPDLVAALDGQLDISLWGKVDSGPNHGLRNTFEVVPDAPVSKFMLELKGGKRGLLVNSENLCSRKAKRRAIVRFTGQNGAVDSFKPKVAASCGGAKQKGSRKR